MEIKTFLKEMSEASGVSGYEAELREIVRRTFAAWADDIREDTLGNVIAFRRGTGEVAGPRRSIMLAGHMDEIGLIVSQLDRGFIRFWQVGGFDRRTLLGQEVLVHSREKLPGVIASRPPHVLPEAERELPVPWDELFIDVGLPSDKLAEMVQVGDIITIRRTVQELENGWLSGKSFDDRAAVAVIGHCLELLSGMKHSWDVYAVATVQEETGLKGALTGAYGINPDIAIAIDVGHGQCPGVSDMDALDMGGGPAIALGPNIHPTMHGRLVEVAKREEIEYQVDPIPGATGTDAWAIQMAREGVPTALISLPLRYMHTSVETLALKDLTRSARLLAHFIASLDESFAEQLGLGPEGRP